MKGKKWWGPAVVIFVFLVGFLSGDLLSDRPAAQANVVYEKLKIFGDVLSVVQTSYVEEPDMDQLVEGGTVPI